MGRRRAAGPIGFMPSDGRFLGSKDLRGLPAGPDAERMPIRVIEVVEYTAGEVVNGKKMEAFWAIDFDRPSDDWLLAPWPKPGIGDWHHSRKEWKIGPLVVKRLALRLGDVTDRWAGAIVPIRLEATTFGRENVWGIRPVPLRWESDSQRVRQAMVEIAAETYEPPGLARRPEAPAPRPTDEPEYCEACNRADGHEPGCPADPNPNPEE